MLSIVVGVGVVVVSGWFMIQWKYDLFMVMRGMLPISFFIGGLIAVIAGLSSLKKPEPPIKGIVDDKKQ
jgi:hypothetical protein